MNSKTVITIGRQFGSGGKEIGEKLAKELGGNLELAVKRIAEMRRERKRSNGKA